MNKYTLNTSTKLVQYFILVFILLIILFFGFAIFTRFANSSKQTSTQEFVDNRKLPTKPLKPRKLKLVRWSGKKIRYRHLKLPAINMVNYLDYTEEAEQEHKRAETSQTLNNESSLSPPPHRPKYNEKTKKFDTTFPKGIITLEKLQLYPEKTPIIKSSSASYIKQPKTWLVLKLTYTNYPSWLDQLKLVYYILFEDQFGNHNLISSNIPYTNIAGGINTAKAYIPPMILKRYGIPKQVLIFAYISKDLAAAAQFFNSTNTWWKTKPTIDGLILGIDKTPFFYTDLQ